MNSGATSELLSSGMDWWFGGRMGSHLPSTRTMGGGDSNPHTTHPNQH